MEFTEEQNKIFKHDPSKHACILAGPGTGKSSTIISYICKVKKQYPEKGVRLLTFTRAANSELADKIIESGKEIIVSSTVHAFAISVLLNNPGTHGLPEPIRIADDWEWEALIRKDLALRLGILVRGVEKLKNEISASWESLTESQDTSISQNLRARYMGLWEEHRRVFGYSLLSELPFRLKTALEGNSELDLGNLNLIAIDEYQDLNACDLNCFSYISKRGTTIIAIGDDDQSIYQFRKANPEGIRRFPEEFQASVYPLSVSHRCGKKILEWANYVIGGDTTRAKKPNLSPSQNNPEGKVGYFVFNRETTEADGVVRLVKWLTESEKVLLEETLILIRTASVGNLIKPALKRANIQFSDPEEFLELLQQPPVRRLLAFLRLMVNLRDSLAWWTLLKITRGIGDTSINVMYNIARSNNSTFGQVILEQYKKGFSGISSSRNKLEELVHEVLGRVQNTDIADKAKWGTWISEAIGVGKLPESPKEFIDLLLRVDETKVGNESNLEQFINQIEPVIRDIINSKVTDKIRVMSLSRSKGLTVNAVIIAGVEDGIIPHPNGDPQEERRLLYVGMTRAREYLFLTRSRRRTGPSARSGRINVAGTRTLSPFLVGGPVNEQDGDSALNNLGV